MTASVLFCDLSFQKCICILFLGLVWFGMVFNATFVNISVPSDFIYGDNRLRSSSIWEAWSHLAIFKTPSPPTVVSLMMMIRSLVIHVYQFCFYWILNNISEIFADIKIFIVKVLYINQANSRWISFFFNNILIKT